jgi:uncharacterized protein
MFLDINQMQLGKVRFHETFPPGAIDFYDPQLRQTSPIESEGVAELLEAILEIRVRGHFSTSMEVACDRCLELTSFPLEADFDLLYRPAATMPRADEIEVRDAETEIGFYQGNGLELSDVLREQVLLALPMQRVCREDCKGICPVCGQHRNLAECACHLEVGDDRWAGLKDL